MAAVEGGGLAVDSVDDDKASRRVLAGVGRRHQRPGVEEQGYRPKPFANRSSTWLARRVSEEPIPTKAKGSVSVL